MDCVMCRYGELALKGKNRNLFERQLVNNIRACMERNGISADIEKLRGRIFVFTADPESLKHLKDVFGLVSINPCVVSERDPDDIRKAVVDYVNKLDLSGISTFRISSHRPVKTFEKTSKEMDILLGDAVGDTFNLKAKMKGADLDIGVEIHDRAFIFHERIACHGGLPLGSGGNLACLIEKPQDIAAAWLFMRRGNVVFPILTGDFDISALARFAYGTDLISSRVKTLAEVDAIMEKRNCKALITGDIFEEFDPERYSLVHSVILSPLIAYDRERLDSLLEVLS